jgi:hypothetical protein
MRPDIAAFFGALIGGGLAVIGQLYISKKERLDKFKIMALEKRLESHQDAFRLWYDLMWSLNDDDQRGVQAEKCNDWWVDNQFYLDKKSSSAFKTAALVANTFGEYRAGDKNAAEERKKAFREMQKVGSYLRKGLGLPHLENEKELEREVLGPV